MEIYEVVPANARVELFVGKPGWEVYMSLPAAIKELEDIIRRESYRFDRTIIKAFISVDWLSTDSFSQHRLLEPVYNWQPVTREDYYAWKTNETMLRRPPEWQYEDRWLSTLPPSESLLKPRIMMTSPRRR
jgi:hypothetical protein